MKILLLHQYFLEKDDGGGSRFNEITKVWSQLGHDVTVLCGMVHYSSGKKLKKYKGKFTKIDYNFYKNVDVIRCHVSESYNVSFIGRLWGYFSFVFSSIYAGIFLAKKDYDIIIVTSPPLFVGITAYVISIIKRLPLVFEIRDLWPESAIDTGILKNKIIIKISYFFEKFIYNKSKLINVLTPAFKEKLVESKKISQEKIIYIPNAADFTLAEKVANQFNPLAFKEKLGFKNNFVFTYVGAHGLANNLIQIIKVAENFKDSNIIFQLIGDGMEKNFLINEVKKRKLNNVIFRDSVSKDQVFKYILSSDVGISVLKNTETFKTIYSNKTFDYMSCKKPVLMAIDGVSRKLVNDAKCGIYVEPENIKSFSEGVLKFLNKSPDDISKMGENGYNFAKNNFDRLLLSKKYVNLIKEKLFNN